MYRFVMMGAVLTLPLAYLFSQYTEFFGYALMVFLIVYGNYMLGEFMTKDFQRKLNNIHHKSYRTRSSC